MHTMSIRQHAVSALFLGAFLSACTVLEIRPQSGAPGDSIKITGSRANDPPVTVEFTGGVSDTMPQLDPSDTKVLTATVPPGAQTGPIRIVAANGSIKSNFDFTVLTQTQGEGEPNNTKAQVSNPSNEIPWGSRIVGAVEDGGTDWLYFKSGPAGPWAYTLEVQVVNKAQEALRAELYIGNTKLTGMTVPAAANANNPKKRNLWVTTLDDADTFLKISEGSTQASFSNPAAYEINIAKIAVNDTRESNDDLASATPLPGGDGERAYLTPAYDPATGTAVGAVDFYEIPGVASNEVMFVYFTTLHMGFTSPVELTLYDKDMNEVTTATAPSTDEPVIAIENLAIATSGGAADGMNPWFLRVATQNTVELHYGSQERSPGRARAPYGLAVVHKPAP